VYDLRWRSTEHLGRGTCGHRRCGSSLGLTTALGTRQRRALGDDRSDQSCRCERVDELLVAQFARVAESSEHRRQNARASSCRCGDDHSHGSVHFLHRKRAREDIAKRGIGERANGTGVQLCRISADETTGGTELARETLRNRAAHHLERTSKGSANLGNWTPLVARLRFERKLREAFLLRVGVADGVLE
jgi:hypothetical protein